MRAVAGPIAEKLSTNDPAEPAGVELSEDFSTLCIREKIAGKSENETISSLRNNGKVRQKFEKAIRS